MRRLKEGDVINLETHMKPPKEIIHLSEAEHRYYKHRECMIHHILYEPTGRITYCKKWQPRYEYRMVEDQTTKTKGDQS